ncbi:MAG: M15 family metallopeptidase [Spirochaetales bacterium]|nr:M15 family metallopeptidase [Spirochaetales bacterium]
MMCTSETVLHPDFTITDKMLNEYIKEFPHPDITEKILANPKEFLESIKAVIALPPEFLFLVDKQHSLGEAYEPEDLENLQHYSIKTTKKSLTLRSVILDDLTTMIDAAKKENIDLVIASAYRSYTYQAQVYGYWVKQLGEEQADRESAKPGHSQHQLGTTLDFYPIDDSFAQTDESEWLLMHASDYGFSLSYPEGYEDVTGYKYEPWHYRYVGKETTQMIDSYFMGIQQFFLEFYSGYADFFKTHLKEKT